MLKVGLDNSSRDKRRIYGCWRPSQSNEAYSNHVAKGFEPNNPGRECEKSESAGHISRFRKPEEPPRIPFTACTRSEWVRYLRIWNEYDRLTKGENPFLDGALIPFHGETWWRETPVYILEAERK